MIANKGINFKADICERTFTWNLHQLKMVVNVWLSYLQNCGLILELGKKKYINSSLEILFKNLFLLYVNMQWFVNVIK